MKGISPIVASVLLIAVTMTIAGILAFWSAAFVEKSLPEETREMCELAYFTFDSCSYNATAQKAFFTLNNKRTISLTNLTAYVYYADGSSSAGIVLNDTLASNTIKSFNITQATTFASLKIKCQCPQVEATNTCGMS